MNKKKTLLRNMTGIFQQVKSFSIELATIILLLLHNHLLLFRLLHPVTLNFFEAFPFGFRNKFVKEDRANQAECCKGEKASSHANICHIPREKESCCKVGSPVGEGGQRHRSSSDVCWINFSNNYPNDRIDRKR